MEDEKGITRQEVDYGKLVACFSQETAYRLGAWKWRLPRTLGIGTDISLADDSTNGNDPKNEKIHGQGTATGSHNDFKGGFDTSQGEVNTFIKEQKL